MAGASGPFTYERIAGGRSNLTYAVNGTRGRKWALRRPPLGKALGSAHDMGREHRVVSALAPTPVPVAPIAGYCTDESVNGAPFYVMEFVEGPILAVARGRRGVRRGRPPGDRRARRRHAGRDPRPGARTRSASAISARRRTTSPASSAAGASSGRDRRRARSRSSKRSTTASRSGSPTRVRRRSSTATTGSTT